MKYTCGICGRLAVTAFRNIRETWPVQSQDGNWWACWEYTSEVQLRCGKHWLQGSEVPKRLKLDIVNRYIQLFIETGKEPDLKMEWMK